MFQNCCIVGKNVDPSAYHSQRKERGDPAFEVSPSMLKEFARCPSRWKAGYQGRETESKNFGSLVDCLLLTPDQFHKRYAIQPKTYASDGKKGADPETKPWNTNSNTCKAWVAAAKSKGQLSISEDDANEANAACVRLLADPLIEAWQEACDKQVWVAGEWLDEATELVAPVRCLLDYAPRNDTEFANCLGDLKSSTSGDLRFFQRQVYQMGYHIQAAFDLELFNQATKESRDHWCFIGVENYHPYEPFKRMLDFSFIEIGKNQVVAALRRYCQCIKTGVWPGYDDNPDSVQGWGICAAEPWMTYNDLSDKLANEVSNTLTIEQKLDAAFGKE